MSATCQNFVQNAWKKDLCANCFKSKDEHMMMAKSTPINVNKPVTGIMKKNDRKRPKRSVEFTRDLVHIIGYGGYNYPSDIEEVDEDEDDQRLAEESEIDDECDKELHKMTKANTYYNTSSFTDTTEEKQSYAHLMLGKPQVDSEGKKQTLLVTVTPFGQEAANTTDTKKISKTVSHIPIAKTKKETVMMESKTNVVLTSYNMNPRTDAASRSLLDEITETLQNAENPITIVPEKTAQGESNDPSNWELSTNFGAEIAQSTSDRKGFLARFQVIRRGQEKPVVHQNVHKIELINPSNLKRYQATENLASNRRPELCASSTLEHSEGEPSQLASAEKLPSEVQQPHGEIREEEAAAIAPAEEISKDEAYVSAETEETSDESLASDASLRYFLEAATTASEPSGGSNTTDDEISSDTVDSLKKGAEIVAVTPKQVHQLAHDSIGCTHVSQSREQSGQPDGRADSPAASLTGSPNADSDTGVDVAGQTSLTGCEKPKLPPKTILSRKPVMNVSNYGQNVANARASDGISEKECSDGSDIYRALNSKRRAPKPPSLEESCAQSPECAPKPAPRRSLYSSMDSLTASSTDKKPKEKRGRFSLKKFLRMGSNKDLPKLTNDMSKSEEAEFQPQQKPRLVIVHPLELDGAKVEVVTKSLHGPDLLNGVKYGEQCASKPPPPPPNSYDIPGRILPLPPKSPENQQKEISKRAAETVYANIGEVRSALTPHKPQRTASMREREAAQQRREGSDYVPMNMCYRDEHVYEYIPGVSGRTSGTNINRSNGSGQKCGSNLDVSGDDFKSQMTRTPSLTYCASENGSDIFSQYSFYGSESEVADDDREWMGSGSRKQKLRSRKGRSIVHKNLEDNYGAVVVANQEALAQVLETIQQTVIIQPALRGLKTASNLRWDDFSVIDAIPPVIVGPRAFHQAMWGGQHVTLLISTGPVPTSTLSLGTFSLVPITEFSDLVPVKHLPQNVAKNVEYLQGNVAVLPWMQINTIGTYGELLSSRGPESGDETWRDASFVLLQLVNALKTLQAQGIEELPLSLTSFVLGKDVDRDSHYRLYVLQGSAEDPTGKKDRDRLGTLCTCASVALQHLETPIKLAIFLRALLSNERASSLTQVKAILEFSLWGPSDVSLAYSARDRELVLQRWLDLQRATVLLGLVCAKVELTVYEECHLIFLVRSTSKMMCDATLLLDSFQRTVIRV